MNQLSGPLATIAVLLLLGFVDDVLDVRWRYKILLSAFGVIPLLLSYDGSVSIVVPPLVAQYWRLPAWTTPTTDICFRPYAPSSLHSFFEEEHRHTIGSFLVMLWQYSQSEVTRLTQLAGTLTQGSSGWTTMRDYVGQHYLCRVPNSATGIDGIMVYLGPLYLLYILCICIFCSNSINILAGINGLEVGQSTIVAVACIVYNVLQLRFTSVTTPSGEWSYIERDLSPDHPIRALLLLFPFVGVSLALYAFNKYPAQVFVGDSYTYFAGTVLAVAAVTGVYSKTLMLFFIPQLINFILSLPQLFGIVPCPRHRVPTWSPVTGKLSNSHNYTLLNAILYVTGDLTERRLCQIVLLFQVVCCVFGFVIRYAAAALFFDMVL
ncbi:UDP-N-acetylglucosamine--dolichyl-phosphate N-acetylglucosaminephosphotransferase [Angomonas deanei]|nr:UDP-N-acetylglucosamine--dolichyl-phosphate N-acetylglucosaminephosphotransferase [Angomonas deanei]|eukprot:EPY42485.1 UDP-N-acetylglucosamine--dolichyl-phosphate N-acetylglucosaminephosphotransferase [Angomonas deanei]